LLRPAALVTFSSSEQAAAAAATAAVTPLTTLVMLYSDYLDLAVYVHPRAAEKQNKTTADEEAEPAAELVASTAARGAWAEAKSALATRRFVKDVTEDEREIVCGTLTDNRQLPEKKGKNKKGAVVAAAEKSVPTKIEKKQSIEKSKKEQPKKEQPKVWMEHNIWRSSR
jgi:hypothetical protein